MTLDQLGDERHRCEAAVRRPPVPAGEAGPRRSEVAVPPKGPKAFLERPRPSDLEVLPPQRAQDQPLGGRQLRRPAQPQVLGTGEPLVPLALQNAVLASPHAVDRLMQVFDAWNLSNTILLSASGRWARGDCTYGSHMSMATAVIPLRWAGVRVGQKPSRLACLRSSAT